MTDYNKKFEDYVKASYIYYESTDEFAEPLMSDYSFDLLCAELLNNWDKVTHPDKHLADEAALAAGTGYQMTFKFPDWAKV